MGHGRRCLRPAELRVKCQGLSCGLRIRSSCTAADPGVSRSAHRNFSQFALG